MELPRGLLVAQSFDWVKPRRAIGGVYAEKDAHGHGEHDGQQDSIKAYYRLDTRAPKG